MNSFSPVWRVDLRIRPSRFYLALLLTLHLLAALAVWWTALPRILQLALLAGIAVIAWLVWQRERRLFIVLREQACDWWLDVGGRSGPVELRRCQVWRYLVLMDFSGHDEKGRWHRRLVIFPDALAPESFRRLRVRLRYGALPARTPQSGL